MTKTTPASAPASAPAVEAAAPAPALPPESAPFVEPDKPAGPKKGHVIYRVLPKGCGEIFTGEERIGEPQPRYVKGDRVEAPAAIAEALQERGFVEIL